MKDKGKPNPEELLDSALVCSPNSVLADFLLYFEPDVVVKFIQIFGGQRFLVPSYNRIWISYRNKVIKDTLDRKNNQVVRQRLAEYFKVSKTKVCQIYWHECHKLPKSELLSKNTLDRIVSHIYKAELSNLLTNARTAFSGRFNSRSFEFLMKQEFDNPEERYWVKASIKELFEVSKKKLASHFLLRENSELLREAIEKLKRMVAQDFSYDEISDFQ